MVLNSLHCQIWCLKTFVAKLTEFARFSGAANVAISWEQGAKELWAKKGKFVKKG